MDQRILLPTNDISISLDVSHGFVVLRSCFPNPVRAYTNFVSVYESTLSSDFKFWTTVKFYFHVIRVGEIVNEKNMLKDCRLDWGPVLSVKFVKSHMLLSFFHNKTMKLGLQWQWWTKLHAEMCTACHNCMKQEINEMVKLTKWSMSFLLEEQEKVTKFHLSFDDTNRSRHSWQSSRHCESCKCTIQILKDMNRLLRFI